MHAHVLANGGAPHGPLTGNWWIDVGIIGGIFVSLLSGATALARKPLRWLRDEVRFRNEFREDWRGVPDRPGVPGRPGLPERVFRIEAEVHPNGGGSMKDAVDAIREIATRTERKLEDHLRATKDGH